MIQISLEATANQEIKFSGGGNEWRLQFKQAIDSMTASVWLNNVQVISCQRIVEGAPIIVYPRLTGGGNFGIVSEGPIDWREFGNSQFLYYWPAE